MTNVLMWIVFMRPKHYLKSYYQQMYKPPWGHRPPHHSINHIYAEIFYRDRITNNDYPLLPFMDCQEWLVIMGNHKWITIIYYPHRPRISVFYATQDSNPTNVLHTFLISRGWGGTTYRGPPFYRKGLRTQSEEQNAAVLFHSLFRNINLYFVFIRSRHSLTHSYTSIRIDQFGSDFYVRLASIHHVVRAGSSRARGRFCNIMLLRC